MRRSTKLPRGTQWYRTLGRLHRYNEAMRHIRKTTRDRTERDQLPASPSTSSEPTDPEVYNARRPTPRPSPPYEVPGRLATITPTHLMALLHQLDEEGHDVVGDIIEESEASATETHQPVYENAMESPALPPRPTRPDRPCPPPEMPERPESTGSEVATTYVEMTSSRAGTRGSTIASSSTDTRITIERDDTRARYMHEPEPAYEELNPPGRHIHPPGERTVPIPQGSPPCRPPVEIPVPVYYKDYANPDVYPAYRLICHSVWYIQVTPDVIICAECATSEHAFCTMSRPLSVWRHLHILSREFCHTTMHCGRCYKLLVHTKRAIDCYQCRQHVIEMRGLTDRLVYKVMCEITVPRTIT